MLVLPFEGTIECFTREVPVDVIALLAAACYDEF